MARILVLYNRPADAAAFDKYYTGTHMPIFNKVSGVRSIAFSAGPPKAIMGTAPHLVVEIAFDSMADLQRALESPEGQAAAADLANFTQAGVTVLAYDTADKPVTSGDTDQSGFTEGSALPESPETYPFTK